MVPKKTRLSTMLQTLDARALNVLAKKHQTSISGIARELILDALDRHEDITFSRLSEERVTAAERKKQKMVRHADAWK